MSDILNTPEGGLDEAIRVGKTYFRELRAERDRLRGELEAALEEQKSEYFRGFRNAMAEVAVCVSCDIRMYRGELWADKILAIIAQRDAATARADAAEAALAELREVGRSVVDRWDSPKWKDQPHTGEVINRLRAAIDAAREVKP